MRILNSTEKLAVDANPILSAIIGGTARGVFLSSGKTIFYTTVSNYREVEKYIPVLASKRNLPMEDLYMALSMLPITVCDENFYKAKIKKARQLIEKRDPDDMHLLALALILDCPIWSNDKDFIESGVKVYSTLDLIKK